MTINITELEKTAEQIVQNVIDHQSSINFIAGMVGILPEVQLAEKFLPLLIGVLQFLQGTTGKSLPEVFTDLVNHITPGQPNVPELTPPIFVPPDHQASTT